MTDLRYERAPKSKIPCLRLSFWGTNIGVYVDNEVDKFHILYYFQDYIDRMAASDRSGLEIWFKAPTVPFTKDLSPDQAVLLQNSEGIWVEYDKPTDSDHMPTLLPPFGLEPLSKELRTVHGCAATPPGQPDKALLIHGPSLAGKSTLLLQLLHQGWSFVADDTVPIDADGRLLSFTRPIGIREATLSRAPWLQKHLKNAVKFNTPTGLTTALHPRDLSSTITDIRPAWEWTVILRRSIDFQVTQLGTKTIQIDYDVANHTPAAASAVQCLVK